LNDKQTQPDKAKGQNGSQIVLWLDTISADMMNDEHQQGRQKEKTPKQNHLLQTFRPTTFAVKETQTNPGKDTDHSEHVLDRSATNF